MLSLVGSVLGFGTSFLPKVLGYFEEKRDQKHELQMMDIDADIRETEALHKEHASITRKSSMWCINLSASVRPIITYCLFIEFALLTFSVNMDWITSEQYKMIWNAEFQAVWAAVVSFWFGQRSFNRK